MNEASQFGPPASATALQPDPQTPEPSVLTARGITKTYTTGIWPRRRTLGVLRGADLHLRARGADIYNVSFHSAVTFDHATTPSEHQESDR